MPQFENKFDFKSRFPALVFCLSLIPICIWFHDRTCLRPDTSLTFDHWWYFHTRLQAHELAQWNPYYFLGRVAVQWNHLPVSLLTPVLYFLNFDFSTFRFLEVTQTYLYLISFYLSGRLLGFERIISMLVVIVLATSGFRVWIAMPEQCYYLLPLAISSVMLIAKFGIVSPLAWSVSCAAFALALLGMRLETIFHLSVFAVVVTLAWLYDKRPQAWLKIVLAIIGSYLAVMAINAWQLGFLLYSTAVSSRFSAEAIPAVAYTLENLLGTLRWMFLSTLQQPLLICALVNFTLIYFPETWQRRSRTLTVKGVFVFIALQTLLFAFALMIPSFQPEWKYIASFLVHHRLGFFDGLRVLAIPVVMAILLFFIRPRAERQFLLSNLFRDAVLFFVAMSVTQYSWQIWPVNLDRHFFFMHPLFNWLMPLGIHGILKNWGRWPIFALLLFHSIGETWCIPLFEFFQIPWNPSRAAFVELPFQILFVGEALRAIKNAIFPIWRLSSLPATSSSFLSSISTSAAALACVVVIYRTLMPQSDGYYAEQWPFAKVAVASPIDKERDWLRGTYVRALDLQKAQTGSPQTSRIHVPDATWSNYPKMKYDYMPSFSQTLNTAPPFSSEIPYYLRLLLLGPAQAKDRIIPPHPETNPLLSAKKSLDFYALGYREDVFRYLDQVILEPHKITDYPVRQLMAEAGSGQARVSIREHLLRFDSDEREYETIRAEYRKSQNLPSFITTNHISGSPSTIVRKQFEEPLKSSWRFIVDQPETIQIAVSSSRKSYLVLFDLFQQSGWTATVKKNQETVPTEIIRAFLGVRAVEIPAGESIVEFRFAIPGLRGLIALSLAVATLLALTIGLFYQRGRR